MRNLIFGFIAGLIVATFAPGLADLARGGFDVSRDLAGSAVQHTGQAARP